MVAFKRLLVSLIPCSGCFWQLYFIVASYLSYPSITEVTQLFDHNFKPPVMVICTLGFVRGNWPKGGQRWKAQEETVPTNARSVLESFANINDSTLQSIRMKKPFQQDQPFKRGTLESQKFFKKRRLCFTIRYCDDIIVSMNSSSTALLFEVVFKSANVNLEIGPFMEVMFYSPRLTPFYCAYGSEAGGVMNYFTFNGHNEKQEYLELDLTYEEMEQELLPSPYGTDCFDYARHGLVSKAYCYEKCMARAFVMEGRGIDRTAYILPGSDLENLTFVEKNDASNAFEANCEKSCFRSDCVIHQFKASKMGEKINNQETSIFLSAPSIPKVKIVYKPQINLIDLTTYALSCVSFWFGWSPLPFLLGLKLFAIKTIMAKKTAQEGQNNGKSPRVSKLERNLTELRAEVQQLRKDLQMKV